MGRLGNVRVVWLMSIQYKDIRSLITYSLLQPKQTSLTSTSTHENWGGLKVTLYRHIQACQASGTNANHSIRFLCSYHTFRKFCIIVWCQIYAIHMVKNGNSTFVIIALTNQNPGSRWLIGGKPDTTTHITTCSDSFPRFTWKFQTVILFIFPVPVIVLSPSPPDL